MKMMPQQYCLRWKHHHSNVQNMFAQLLEKERFCDVTLYCSPSFSNQVPNKDTVDPQNIRGVSLRAHRVVLAACSELLGSLLGAHEAHGEPVLVIDGAEPKHMKALLDYMYTGEMNVHHSQLASLLKTAEELRIKGLTDIRWNNKDEPPDCQAGNLGITTTGEKKSLEQKSPELRHELRNTSDNRPASDRPASDYRPASDKPASDRPASELTEQIADARTRVKKETESELDHKLAEKFNVNGGPPPLIKLPTKDKGSPVKRENSDTDSPSPKRQRMISATENTDDDESRERDQEWQHGNLIQDITAERVVGWGVGESGGEWSRDASDDEWADAPADIGSFLHTRLRVDGDNSADEESNDEGSAAPPAVSTSTSTSTSLSACSAVSPADIKVDMLHAPINKPTVGPKSGPTDPRFTDVVKLNDYLQHGRRPQFWEENYVKRVMEAVRLKELEMKQAAEILGVSYGTLYGRYRDVYGCINRPYREGHHKTLYSSTARDYWQAKGPSEVLDRLQRGDISLDAASQALGVTPANLAAYVADVVPEKEFEPIPIEIDPSLKMKPRSFHAPVIGKRYKPTAPAPDKMVRKVMVGSIEDEDPIPATVITTHEGASFAAPTTTTSGKWPSIRVASLDTLRETPPTDPSQLMRTRPDLTIVAARRADHEADAT